MGATEQFPLSAFADCEKAEIEAVIARCKVPVNGTETEIMPIVKGAIRRFHKRAIEICSPPALVPQVAVAGPPSGVSQALAVPGGAQVPGPPPVRAARSDHLPD